MTKRIREGLGLLCVAAICLVIGLAARSGDAPSAVGDIGVGVGGFLALIGLAWLAAELFTNHPGD